MMIEYKKRNNENRVKGITLIALVVTIVVLLILAGITIQLVFNNEGILNQAQNASKQYKIAQARERLEITLNNAQIDKAINKNYNENDYLDDFILKNTANTKIVGEIVIVDEYAFEIDRSIPKIEKYIGEESELIFPKVTTNVKIEQDLKTATITINAKEEENGINKIEIIQNGYILKTYTYENKKEEIIENYVAKQNGIYKIKVYSKLNVIEKTEVQGLIMLAEYTPNGNEKYQKEHQVKVTVKEDTDKIKSIQYQWLQTTVEPEINSFTEKCDNGAILNKNGITGIWYLWTLVETQSGKSIVSRSEGFYFDNEKPDMQLTYSAISENSFQLIANATDEYSKIARYDFYINDTLEETITTAEETTTYEVNKEEMGETPCYVIVTDNAGNSSKQEIVARTMMHTWAKNNVITTTTYKPILTDTVYERAYKCLGYAEAKWEVLDDARLDKKTGTWKKEGTETRSYLGWGGVDVWLPAYGPVQLQYAGTEPGPRIGNYYTNYYCYNAIVLSSEAINEYSKGTENLGNVYSNLLETYPQNGEQDRFWYEYIGIQ